MLDKIDLEVIVAIAKDAGDAIMEIYDKDFQIDYKDDKSPLTEADTKSNEIICDALLPALEKIIQGIEDQQHPYRQLLNALQTYLTNLAVPENAGQKELSHG